MPTAIEDLVVSGNGLAFVAPHVRPGVLPRLLREILETRVMVKAAMKACRGDCVLRRRFNARQFALKLIANVTYGYTAAGAAAAGSPAATHAAASTHHWVHALRHSDGF